MRMLPSIKSYLHRLIVQFGLSQLETVVSSITLISNVMTEAAGECVVPTPRVQTPELALVLW